MSLRRGSGPPVSGGFCVGADKDDGRFDTKRGPYAPHSGFVYIAPPQDKKWGELRNDTAKVDKFNKVLDEVERKSMRALLMIQWFRLLLNGGYVHNDVLKEINRIRREAR